ncbi:HTH-type transcriptional activator CmpR [Botrimarina colliarenosi]|uniref:HTH-type transcriptional activator CmpR n=1 Tax=Botrimarina colliarenosi TaxID=2528001 RepID=A0A5C6AL73_9BACT|nr:LysR family transcriptional regulator [Botrimarina colliarenosi]TWU00151.1 HTH-type transcriptional activator CmpR [Botrimarina colliarenosi]
MHLKSLKVFCDIIRLGSFSKAAALNGVSQPSASQLVNHLEDRLGVELIDRSRRPFRVTEAGKAYYEGCRDLVQRYESLEGLVRGLQQSPGGRLRVAAIYSVGLGQIHRVVEEFHTKWPNVELRIDYMHPDQVRAAVLAGEADLGVTSFPEADRQISVTPWRDEAFALAVNPDHALASARQIAVQTLDGERMVMPQAGLRVRDEIDRWLASHRVTAKVAAEFDNLEFVKRAIEVGEGIGLLPGQTFVNETFAGTLVRIDLVDEAGRPETFVRPLGVLRRRDDEVSQAAENFLQLLDRHANDSPEPLPRAATAGSKDGGAAQAATV